jgi:hypothetical protein
MPTSASQTEAAPRASLACGIQPADEKLLNRAHSPRRPDLRLSSNHCHPHDPRAELILCDTGTCNRS